ncbi:MAG TPA: BolA/IbaG family iron-sulfur metabolism protein [Gammaproteobacteria bacterium]|jgi:acid stress-induced BolA-like protein IbaG/YrbA|nr:BolA/IbaG family iron-sulfur metabolism protein [Gammaproteobacteria bacterium]HKH20342.1 BolA/IbaG family iron-sulfur metabolism protein [Gammaproteobacteria bacterium]
MHPDEIKQLIEAGLPGASAFVTGDGYKFEAIVVSQAFEDLSMLKEQQMIYATVQEQIASGALHALTIKAYTPAEWQVLNEQ